MSSLPVALIFGGSGKTAVHVIRYLVKDRAFRTIKVPIRPSSQGKPTVTELKKLGVEVIPFDLERATPKELQQIQKGVDTVVCMLSAGSIHLQPQIIDAAKIVGVKRFVPDDFGTPGRTGVRKLHDEKHAIREYVIKAGLNYTFIDTGYWYQYNLPPLTVEQAVVPFLYETTRWVYNDGDVKAAFTDLDDIAKYVARIVADPRTLNQYVFAWGEEVTQLDMINLAREYGGPSIQPIKKTTEELLQLIKEEMTLKRGRGTYFEYMYSLWVLGEDVYEKAKLPEFGGAINGKELYPDIKVRSFKDYAAELYSEGDVGEALIVLDHA